ncbi:LuxE/PaaK family acyltransferase [Puia dinghuensis]|uniref:Acyltransferase n=1 Tax=Puia dinghuensis TaxID=1792502 RepID=A0A8J2U972_9BACT|nr:acyl transferase [Puia dinghuensis]GGA86998.1 acyltransferase [Puia dinghuensis]
MHLAFFNNWDPADFTSQALELFRFQFTHNALYRRYAETLGVNPAAVARLEDIPFLPVSFFKTHAVKTTDFIPETVFTSSGTTGMVSSRHEVKDLELYKASFRAAFEQFYGPIRDWCIIGLLPSYLERTSSSLVVMVHDLIEQSGHPQSGFYLYEHEALHGVLQQLEARGQKTLLIGVTFALLDFAEKYSMSLRHTVIMETGGMKGRRRELIRGELHAFLSGRLGVETIHAEYGMTELLSQAYSPGQGLFTCPSWMRMLVRTEDDPLEVRMQGEGILNVIDLANRWSCAFLATDDVGRIFPDGRFEVSGRVDNSDIRGCSLLVA